uniref:Uncharacterized protein n=1 Tax=Colobus angolensis palliatus TaxID=336983 RepID=A0A2K5HMK9_COLAP
VGGRGQITNLGAEGETHPWGYLSPPYPLHTFFIPVLPSGFGGSGLGIPSDSKKHDLQDCVEVSRPEGPAPELPSSLHGWNKIPSLCGLSFPIRDPKTWDLVMLLSPWVDFSELQFL